MFLLSCQHAWILLQAKPSEIDRKGVALYLEDKPVSVCLRCVHQPALPSRHSSLHPPLCQVQLTSHLLLLFLLRAPKKRMPLQSTLSGKNSDSNQVVSSQWDGKSFEQLRQECLQKGVLFEDPDFPAADASLFFSQSVPVQIEWKRPKVCRLGNVRAGWCLGCKKSLSDAGICWKEIYLLIILANESYSAKTQKVNKVILV